MVLEREHAAKPVIVAKHNALASAAGVWAPSCLAHPLGSSYHRLLSDKTTVNALAECQMSGPQSA